MRTLSIDALTVKVTTTEGVMFVALFRSFNHRIKTKFELENWVIYNDMDNIRTVITIDEQLLYKLMRYIGDGMSIETAWVFMNL